jgi:hypothetical protein
MIARRSDALTTLQAELLGVLLAEEAGRTWSHLSGSLSTKIVRGHKYLYFHYFEPGGRLRQLSLGRQTPELLALVARRQQGANERANTLELVKQYAAMLRAARVPGLPHGTARVLSALADAGLFRFGAVLVGSHAFARHGDALGVTWPEAAWRTEDIDVAGTLEIATPELTSDVPATLESLQMGFVPVPQLDPRHPSTSFMVRGKTLRVDLLTPGRDGQVAPVPIPRFRAAAAPIKFLSLLLVEPMPAIALHSGGATLVTVPSPARFALHKLLISQTRSLVQQMKSGKDLHQAALLLEVLAEDRPDDLSAAAQAFADSGPAVVRKVLRGLARVEDRWPDAHAGVKMVRGELQRGMAT